MIPRSKRRLLFLAVATVLGGVAFVSFRFFRQPVAPDPPLLSYVGTQTCAACHRDAYQRWSQSDHRHAMQIADSQSVLGDFENATFDYAGIRSRFFTREGKYYVETDNAQGELEIFEIAYTFGHDPLQQYLVPFPDGRLQALSIVWDARPAGQGGQRWYHLYPDQKIAHDDPLHWTGAFQNWNSRCAGCHTTNLEKNYSREGDHYATRWAEINVGCEACHGPGSRHAAWAEDGASTGNHGLIDIGSVWKPPEAPPAQADYSMGGQLQVCSGCHSGRLELRHPDVHANYFDNYNLGPLVEERYHPDGQFRNEEVYETGSFLQSRMHANQVTCSNCHDPHSGRLRAGGNTLCLQCHDAQRFQTREHHLHETGSTGAQCVNCHMPRQTYMGVDVRRDHSFRIPDPVASLELGVPNACTQCHTDRSDRWAADILAQRSNRKEPRYAHAELLSRARKNDASVAAELRAYALNRSYPPILRSIAVMESARFSSPENINLVTASLSSPDPLVRSGGASALGQLEDANERLARLQPVLADPSKAVRMIAARQLAALPLQQAPPQAAPTLARLFDEYQASLLYNADMPESMNDLGLLLGGQGDLAGAEQAFQHARKLAPRYLPAMLNLSDLYRARGRDDLGEPLLRDAVGAYPESGDARHALGLLYVRTGRAAESVPLLEQATRLAPGNPQYALVYAVALVENGRRPEGIRVLQSAARRFPGHAPIREALEAYQSQ